MIRIRKATRDDGQAAWDVRREAVLAQCVSRYPLELMMAWTSNGPSANWIEVVANGFWVAVEDDEVIATCMLTVETGKVDAIFVRPTHMNRGVGAFVMQFVETMARRHGVAMLTLEATLNAAPFYRRCGFTGEKIEKYRSPRGLALDCIPMVKRLDAERDANANPSRHASVNAHASAHASAHTNANALPAGQSTGHRAG